MTVQSSALDALTQLHAEMQGEFHHNAVDIPVSVNLDDWIERLGTIIEALRVKVVTRKQVEVGPWFPAESGEVTIVQMAQERDEAIAAAEDSRTRLLLVRDDLERSEDRNFTRRQAAEVSLRDKLAAIEQRLRRAVDDPALWRSDIFAVRMAVSACADQIAALRRKD